MTLLPHVLLVEDSVSYRKLVAQRLALLGATVVPSATSRVRSAGSSAKRSI